MKKILLTRGYESLVDDDDFVTFSKYKWRAVIGRSTVYAHRETRIEKKRVGLCLHREILAVKDSSIHVDHINGNGLDNRKSNLRICSHKQNMYNSGPKKNSRSGIKGVYLDKRTQLWRARIRIGKISRSLGYYASKEEAGKKYAEEALKIQGEFIHSSSLKYLK